MSPNRFPKFHRVAAAARILCGILLLLGARRAAGEECPPGATCESVAPAYPFFERNDEVALAMRTVWLSQFETHPDPEAAGAALEADSAAEAVIRANRELAARHLSDSLQRLTPADRGGFSSLNRLLQLVGEDPAILAQLFEIASAAPPVTPPGPDAGDEPVSGQRLVRAQALEHIVAVAGKGSEQARTQLFELLASPDPSLRAGAVRGLYRISRKRAEAQREMRRVLDVDQHYLLYRF